MNHLILGKALETIGAVCLSYVAVRAAAIELFIVLPLHTGGVSTSALDNAAQRLQAIQQARSREFGRYEAVIVALGTVCVTLGCAWYLLALAYEK